MTPTSCELDIEPTASDTLAVRRKGSWKLAAKLPSVSEVQEVDPLSGSVQAISWQHGSRQRQRRSP